MRSCKEPPSPNRKLGPQIAGRLEEAIFDGTFELGKRLPTEAELCEAFGVSRTPLREALQQLKDKGLIEAGPGRGMFLRSVSPKLMSKDFRLFATTQADEAVFCELMELRLMIEPENAARAAKEKDPELLQKLATCLKAMKASAGDLPRFIRNDISMHVMLAEASSNRFIEILFACLRPVAERYGRESYGSSMLVNETIHAHTDLLDAIGQGAPGPARRIMKQHLSDSLRHFQASQPSTTKTP